MNTTTPPARDSSALYSMAFFDVQNLFRHAKNAFHRDGADKQYHHPNFDPIKLHHKVALAKNFSPTLTRFYTGVPSVSESEMWGEYWNSRVLALKRQGVTVETRPLKYHQENLPDGTSYKVAHEKGIDVRISLDLVACARRKEFDAAIIFSQDQDLSEAVKEIKSISKEQGRYIKIISAFPESASSSTLRGINGAEWFRFDQAFYDGCIDPHDYRPAKFQPKKGI